MFSYFSQQLCLDNKLFEFSRAPAITEYAIVCARGIDSFGLSVWVANPLFARWCLRVAWRSNCPIIT